MEEITVILNGYKRPEYLREQIEAIRNQSIKPKEVWLWINDPKNFNTLTLEWVDVVVESSRNFKYHGRFSLGLLAKTKYLAVFDDDTIPGSNWFKNCLDTLKIFPNSILGGAGCILQNQLYINHTRAGWPSKNDDPIEVDLVGHAWFFERAILNNLWSNNPPSLENGEDIQLSFQSYINSGIKSICPPHPYNDSSMWSSLKPWEYGNDDKASSNGSLMSIPKFYKERDDLIMYYLHKGYKPVIVRK